MAILSLLTSLPAWAIFLLTTFMGILAAETGVWLAQRKIRKGPKAREVSIGTLLGAILGLLAFMLGFTFSITASRFDARKELVVDQAKALETCYLRTSLLPDSQKLESRKLLREYVDILVQTQKSADIEKGVSKLEALHISLWNQTASLSRENMDSELRSLYISSVNEVIDIFRERKTVALVFRIPSALWTSLFLLFILSMFVVGYEIGSYSTRRVLDTPMMATAFALVVTLIATMDSVTTTGAQRFRVSQLPLAEVQKMISQEMP